MSKAISREPMYAYYNQYSGCVVLETIDAEKWSSSQKLDKYLKENEGSKSDYFILPIYLTIEVIS